jgi:hypothetical protein
MGDDLNHEETKKTKKNEERGTKKGPQRHKGHEGAGKFSGYLPAWGAPD